MSAKLPLSTRRYFLPLCGVRVECLDRKQTPIKNAVASGFIRKESDRLFLYTAWHVVTGYDPNHLDIGTELPNRRYLRVPLQDARSTQPGIQAIGGSQAHVLPLYADAQASAGPLHPLWHQNEQHVPNRYLNAVGLFVPFWHDVVKIELPNTLRLSDLQLIDEAMFMSGSDSLVGPGEKCLIVGYPYGFSAAIGKEQPTPVVFTRFVASAHISGERNKEVFLDGYGAPGMSGGPVFIEREDSIFLFGMYTGDIYPDFDQRREKTTALGTVTDIRMIYWGHIPLVETPQAPLNRDGSPGFV